MSKHYHIHENTPGCLPEEGREATSLKEARAIAAALRAELREQGYRQRAGTGLGRGAVRMYDPASFGGCRERVIEIVPCEDEECLL